MHRQQKTVSTDAAGERNPLLRLQERHAYLLLVGRGGVSDPAGERRMSWERALLVTCDTQPAGVDENDRLLFRLQHEDEDGTTCIRVETHDHETFLEAHRVLSAWYPVCLLETSPDAGNSATTENIESPKGPGAPDFRTGQLHLRGGKVLSWLREHGARGRHHIPHRGTWVDTAEPVGGGASGRRRSILFDLRRAVQEAHRHNSSPEAAKRDATSKAQAFDCIADVAVVEPGLRTRRRRAPVSALGR